MMTSANYYEDEYGVWRYAADDEPVPGAVTTEDGMWAPELHPSRLLDSEGVARMLGIQVDTIKAYRSRGQIGFPVPEHRYGQAPVWSAEVIRRWDRRRPGKGGRPRRAASA